METDSTELARRASEGDRASLDALWRRHRRWVAAVILAHRPPGADVDDLLQDVAMALVKTIHLLREPQRHRAWLRAVVVNTVRTFARRSFGSAATVNGSATTHCRSAPEAGISSATADGHAADRDDSRSAEAARVLAAIEAMPVHYRETLLLRGVRELSIEHIAETLDLPVKTVETRLLRGRRMIWEAMSGPSDPAILPLQRQGINDSRHEQE